MNPNGNSLALLAVKSVCMLGKVHQLIWQWPIVGEQEVGDSNQLVLAKISCPGRGDPILVHSPWYSWWWQVGGGGGHSMLSIKNTCRNLTYWACVCRCRCSPSVLMMIDSSQRLSGNTKTKTVMEGQCQRPALTRWVRTVDQGSRAIAKLSLCFTLVHSGVLFIFYFFYIFPWICYMSFLKNDKGQAW